MKNLNDKIAAFTLVEVIMVMILSLLVLGVILLGFRHFQQYSAIQEKESKRLEDVLLVQSALNTWFFKAHEIHLTDDAIHFKDSVVFGTCKLEEELVILESNGSADRFKIAPKNQRVTTTAGLPFVKELYFEISNNGVQNAYLFQKEYGKSVLFNGKEKNDEH